MSQAESTKDEPPATSQDRGGVAAPAPVPDPKVAEGSSVFSYAGFRTLFIGSLAGTLADRLYQFSLISIANLIFVGIASERNAIRVQIAATIPGVLLYSATSSMIDTMDRRFLMTIIKALKVVAVLLLVPLLWSAVYVDDDGVRAQLISYWPWCLGIVFLLNVISVPFSPARAAAVPDVVPEIHRSTGASLMATTGLISVLIGSALGGVLVSRTVLGPAKVVVLASALYVLAAVLFRRLPDAAAVPGNKRGDAAAVAAPKQTLREYLDGVTQGFRYSLAHGNVLGLTFFQTVFWTIASAFNFLFQVHLRTGLALKGDAKTMFFGLGFGCAGLGLFGGAIGIGKICRKVSPIVTYTPAFILVGIGLLGVFSSHADASGHPPAWLYPVMFSLGLGGGLILGRVDADVLASVDPEYRGRVFSFKALAFAITTLVTTVALSEILNEEQTQVFSYWLPRAVFMMLPVTFVFSWIVDIAIWSKRADVELPGPFHRFGYRVMRGICWFALKIVFRYSVEGVENVPMSGPIILAANHASFLDPIYVGCSNKRLVQWIIYSAYYRSFAHPLFRFLRCIPVDEKDHLGALKAGVRSLNKGACIGIFPEGRVSYDGNPNPPQRGALFLAQRSGALVVPFALKGNFRALPRGAWFPRFTKVTPLIGKPFPVPKELSKKETGELAHKLMCDIAAKLNLPPPPTASEE